VSRRETHGPNPASTRLSQRSRRNDGATTGPGVPGASDAYRTTPARCPRTKPVIALLTDLERRLEGVPQRASPSPGMAGAASAAGHLFRRSTLATNGTWRTLRRSSRRAFEDREYRTSRFRSPGAPATVPIGWPQSRRSWWCRTRVSGCSAPPVSASSTVRLKLSRVLASLPCRSLSGVDDDAGVAPRGGVAVFSRGRGAGGRR